MPSQRRFLVALVAITIVIGTSFSAGQAHRTQAQGEGTVVADTGFNPETDGFNFRNYYSANLPYANMTPVELHRMFGDKVCEPGTESKADCTLIPPAAQWMETTNSAMNGGHCGGMAILSELFFSKQADLSYFSADQTVGIEFNDYIQREIAYWWGTNAIPIKRTYTVRGKPSEVVQALVESIKNKDETYSLEVWKDLTSGKGHAVTPFRVVDMGNGIVHIIVYDNNYPKQSSVVEVDVNNETWQYNLSVNPGVEPKVWSGDAESNTMFLARNTWRLQVQDPSFLTDNESAANFYARTRTDQAADKYNAITLSSADHTFADLLITDDQGHKFGVVGDKVYAEIPGAFIERLPTADASDNEIQPVYYIPIGIKFTMTLDGTTLTKPAVNDVVMIGPGYDLALDGISVKPGDKDTIVFSPDGTEIAYTPSDPEAPNITLGVEHQGADYEFEILGSDVDKGGTINVKLDYAKGQLVLHTSGNTNPASYNLIIDRYDNATDQTYQSGDLTLDPAATIYIEFGKWDGKGDLSIGVDDKSDGSVDKTDTQGNQKK